MRTVALPVGCTLLVALSCGGPAFTAGPGGDDAGSGSGSGDASSGASSGADVIVLADVVAEAPTSCASGSAVCMPAVPSGWTGPLEVYAGQGPLPTCTAGYQPEEDGFDQLSAPDAACGCTCSPAKVLCSAPTITFNTAPGCVTATCASELLAPAACTTINESNHCAAATAFYMSAEQAAVSSAVCAAQSSKSVPPIAWGVQARACVPTVAPTQLDCPSGSVCAPLPNPGFPATACIAMQGDVACPAGPYSVKRRFFGEAIDTRDCANCTCGAPPGASCTASLDVYSSTNATCSGNKITYPAPFTCAGVNQPGDFLLTLSSTSSACPASASSPTGGAVPAKPVTVCCTP
jgi:hypothetical protein